MLLCLLLLLLVVLPVGCGVPVEIEQEDTGGETPREVVGHFLDNLNQALQDPNLEQPKVREVWALQLASHFAPSERANQRLALEDMLTRFATSLSALGEDEQLTIEIRYESIRLDEQHGNRGSVYIVDGWLNLRQVHVAENGRKTVRRDQGGPLLEVIGLKSKVLPVLRVNGRWFLTEYPQ